MARAITFKTFLLRNCRNRSGAANNRLTSFLYRIDRKKELKPYLFLYALYFPKETYFKRNLSDSDLYDFAELEKEYQNYNSPEEMLHKSNNLKEIYYRIFDEYLSEITGRSSDSLLKIEYLNNIKNLMAKTGISAYRIVTDNDLNIGNFYAFLKGGHDKLSINNCRKVILYLIRKAGKE